MKNERMTFKRYFIGPPGLFPALLFFSAFFSASSYLFAASVTNEGETTVKMSARSSQGITGGGSIKPGQSLHLKNDVLWIEHVLEGGSVQVRLKIIGNDGRAGYINTPGGRYTFQPVVESKPTSPTEKKRSNLASGYADNRSNVALSLNIVNRTKAQNFLVLRPGQKTVIPEDTVEVRVDQYGWVSGDAQISLSVVMPDGKERVVRTSHAVVRIDSAAN